MNNNEVENWRLKQIVKAQKSYDAKNTFKDDDILAQLIALESALQVSNSGQRYKEWLHEILTATEEDRKDPAKLLKLMEKFTAVKILELKRSAGCSFYSQGLQTPRLVLNVIDYLMWQKCNFNSTKKASEKEKNFAVPKDIIFKYLNSVEHHHPQHDDQVRDRWPNNYIDDIGNLFLIYSRENSSMNNRQPQEKKNRYMNSHGNQLPEAPKRHWMYEHTHDDGTGWSLEDMKELSRYVQELVEEFITQAAGIEEPHENNNGEQAWL